MKRTIIGFMFAVISVSLIIMTIAFLEMLLGLKITANYQIERLGSVTKYQYYILPVYLAGRNEYGLFNMELVHYSSITNKNPCYSVPKYQRLFNMSELSSYIYVAGFSKKGSWKCGNSNLKDYYGMNSGIESPDQYRFPAIFVFGDKVYEVRMEMAINNNIPSINWVVDFS